MVAAKSSQRAQWHYGCDHMHSGKLSRLDRLEHIFDSDQVHQMLWKCGPIVAPESEILDILLCDI